METIKPHSGWIKQNEVLIKEGHHWLHFSNPHQIITTEKLEDVLPAIQEIERLIAVNVFLFHKTTQREVYETARKVLERTILIDQSKKNVQRYSGSIRSVSGRRSTSKDSLRIYGSSELFREVC